MSQAQSPPSPKERQRLLNERRREQQDQEARSAASSMAQSAAQQGQFAAPGYWDVIGSPDIEREQLENDEFLGEFLATEFSDKFALGNITYADYQSWLWRIENEFFAIKNEFRSPDSRLDKIDMATMGYGKRPELTDERARRLRSAMQVKKMLASLSVGGRGLRSGTEIHAVARSENDPAENDEESLWGTAKRYLGR